MIEYTIVQSDGLTSLFHEVNEHIREGWEPQGGGFTATQGNAEFACQAMIKRPPND